MESDRGIWRVCPTCGERFYILYPEMWVYKMEASQKNGDRPMLYFNKYSCKRKYEDGYVVELRKRKSDAMKKLHAERRKKKLEEIDGGKNEG